MNRNQGVGRIRDPIIHISGDIAGIAAAAARATDRNANRARRIVCGRDIETAGDIQATITAAAADALRNNPIRAITAAIRSGLRGARDIQGHIRGRTAITACAANTDTNRSSKTLGEGDVAGHIQTAIAAAAAHALRNNTIRIRALGRDITIDRRVHGGGIAA